MPAPGPSRTTCGEYKAFDRTAVMVVSRRNRPPEVVGVRDGIPVSFGSGLDDIEAVVQTSPGRSSALSYQRLIVPLAGGRVLGVSVRSRAPLALGG